MDAEIPAGFFRRNTFFHIAGGEVTDPGHYKDVTTGEIFDMEEGDILPSSENRPNRRFRLLRPEDSSSVRM